MIRVRQEKTIDPQYSALDRIRGWFQPEETADTDGEVTFVRNEVYLVVPPGDGAEEAAGAIAAECERFGLAVVRDRDVDAVEHPLGLPAYQSLERAEFVLIDLSHPHPSVLIQLGLAYGIGNEPEDVLLVAREGAPDVVEVAPFTLHLYRTMADLRRIIAVQLPAMREASDD